MKLPTPKQLPSGNWRVQIMVDGKVTSVTDTTEKRVLAKALAIREEFVRKQKSAPAIPTLEEAISDYIESRTNVLSPSTIRGYKSIQKQYLSDIKKKKVTLIDELVLQKEINKLALDHTAKTIKNIISLAVAAMKRYQKIDVEQLRYPQYIRKEHSYLSGPEILSLFEAVEGHRIELPVLLAVWLGLRRSEILGLHWESIDLERNKIRVENALVVSHGGEPVIKNYMKNETSRRTLDLPNYISQKLKKVKPEGDRHGLVFNFHHSTIYNDLETICKQAGIPFVGVHGLRHTNASVMLSLGIVDKIAMARGGWSTPGTMKNIYQHVFESDMDKASAAMDNYFEGLSNEKSSV